MRVHRLFMTADTVGGVWGYSLELARALSDYGVQVTLAAMGGRLREDQRRAAQAVPGLRVHDSDYRLEWMQDPWADLQAAEDWLLELAHEAQPDLVHLNHYAHGHLDWPAPRLTVAHSCVYSWFSHVKGQLPGPEWQRYRDVVRRGLQASDAVVAPSACMLKDAARYYGPLPRCRVIHNGRQPADFPPGRKAPVVLSAGRLWDEAKNVASLARAAPDLDWPVYLAGEARHPDSDGRAALANVELLGQLDQAELAAWYGRAGIYALPARYEPFGLSALEAALAGCALVLGDIPSLREVWGDSAVYVPPDDHRALARSIQGLIEEPERRRQLAAQARVRARSYESAAMARRYLRLYIQLATRPALRAQGA